MSFIDKYFIKLFHKKIAQDHYGNEYYLSHKKDYLGRKKRYIIYNGLCESTKIPPMWHAWLHYMIDDTPDKIDKFDWQIDYRPNLSGTNFAYDPSKSKNKKIDLFKKWHHNK